MFIFILPRTWKLEKIVNTIIGEDNGSQRTKALLGKSVLEYGWNPRYFDCHGLSYAELNIPRRRELTFPNVSQGPCAILHRANSGLQKQADRTGQMVQLAKCLHDDLSSIPKSLCEKPTETV